VRKPAGRSNIAGGRLTKPAGVTLNLAQGGPDPEDHDFKEYA
jgi:hypothetical protein